MLLNLDMLEKELLRRVGDTSPDAREQAYLYLNQALENLISEAAPPHLITVIPLDTLATYSTGTVAVTQGSRKVTGTSTVWRRSHVGRMFRLTGGSEQYLVRTRVSGTQIKLETPYAGATATAQGYELLAHQYSMRRKVLRVRGATYPAKQFILTTVTPSVFADLVSNPTETGDPVYLIDRGFTATAYYNAGTVKVDDDSKTVTGTNTSWSDAAVTFGMSVRIAGDMREYDIDSVSSNTGITLQTTFRGITRTTQEYAVEPAGRALIELYPYPTAKFQLMLNVVLKPEPLFLPTDVPRDIPPEFHLLIVEAAQILYRQSKGDAATDLMSVFQKGIEQLKGYYSQRSGEIHQMLGYNEAGNTIPTNLPPEYGRKLTRRSGGYW